MELLEIVAGRRSIRRYRTEAVPRALLEKLLEAACWAPSADNAQPWHFVALTRPEDILAMGDTLERVSEEIRPHLTEMFPNHPRVVERTAAFLRRLGGAPVYVLVFLRRDYGPQARDSMLESVAAAIENFLLAAHAEGLGACWVNAATNLGYGEALRKQFAPDRGEFVSIISLGYPAQRTMAPPRKPGRWEIR